MTRDEFLILVCDGETLDTDTVMAEYDRLTDELAALRAEREWIPVSERLPDKPGRYLTLRGNQYDLDLFTDGFRDWWYNDGVTHWMPLAALPEGSAK